MMGGQGGQLNRRPCVGSVYDRWEGAEGHVCVSRPHRPDRDRIRPYVLSP